MKKLINKLFKYIINKEAIFYNGDLDYMYVNCLGKGEYGEANANAPILNNAINCGENDKLKRKYDFFRNSRGYRLKYY